MQILGSDQVEHEHAANVGSRDGDADGLGSHQIDKTQHDSQCAGLAQHTAVDAHEQIQQAQLGRICHSQRGSLGQLIHRCIREHPLIHGTGKADEQHDTAHQSGVCKVHANAAEQLLDNDDSHQIADDQLTDGHSHGHVHGKNDAGDHSGQVADGVCTLQQLAVQPLKGHTGYHGNGGDQQGAHAENDRRGNHAGAQCNDHVRHQALGGLVTADVRGSRNNKLRIHYLLPPFLISPR